MFVDFDQGKLYTNPVVFATIARKSFEFGYLMFRKKQSADENSLNEMALFFGQQKRASYDEGYRAGKADALSEITEAVERLAPPGERKLIEAPVSEPAPPPQPPCSIEALFVDGYKATMPEIIQQSGKRPAQVRKTLNAMVQAGKVKQEGNLFLGTDS